MSKEMPSIECEKCQTSLPYVASEAGDTDTCWGKDREGVFLLCPNPSCKHKNYKLLSDHTFQCLNCGHDLTETDEVPKAGENVKYSPAWVETGMLVYRCLECGKGNVTEIVPGEGLKAVKLID